MRIAHARLLLLPTLIALAAPSSAPERADEPPTIAEAKAEMEAASARSAALSRSAEKAAGTLARVQSRQRAAAGELETAEARIVLAGLDSSRPTAAAAKRRAGFERRRGPHPRCSRAWRQWRGALLCSRSRKRAEGRRAAAP